MLWRNKQIPNQIKIKYPSIIQFILTSSVILFFFFFLNSVLRNSFIIFSIQIYLSLLYSYSCISVCIINARSLYINLATISTILVLYRFDTLSIPFLFYIFFSLFMYVCVFPFPLKLYRFISCVVLLYTTKFHKPNNKYKK